MKATTKNEGPSVALALTLRYMADWVADHDADVEAVSVNLPGHRIYLRDVEALRRIFPGKVAKCHVTHHSDGAWLWYAVKHDGIEFTASEKVAQELPSEVEL